MSNPLESVRMKLRESVTLKLFVTIVLALILLVPATMIESLIDERQQTRDNAVAEISSKWGGEQRITGPVLSVPYRIRTLDSTGKQLFVTTQTAHFLPQDLKIDGTLAPEVRYRGIFEAVLYNARLHLTGTFRPTFDAWDVKPEDIIWKEAVVSLGIPDMRGIRESMTLQWDGVRSAFQPGVRSTNLFASGVSASPPARIDSSADSIHSFAIDLSLNGSGTLGFLPLGRETNVRLSSAWGNPSFMGAFLPNERTITPDSFSASWKILDMNRNFPQQWRGEAPEVEGSEFGVSLLVPVDNYQQSTRSVKYAGLFIALTFLTFFLIEILNHLRVHPIQYLLVGCALVLFYLLLVSLSEHMSFGASYAIACAGIVGLVTFYTASVFRRASITAITFVVVAALYGYLYVLLQMQDLALLLGSLGMFLILAAVMYVTRRTNWYAVGRVEESGVSDDAAAEVDTVEV